MALELTQNAFDAVSQVTKQPNLVLKIEGVDDIFGALVIGEYAEINEILEIGDPDLNPLSYFIGGVVPVANQQNLISFDGTSTSIKQTLNVDKGQGGSITNMVISLIDTGYMTRLITPGEIIPDILQAKAKLYLGFYGTAWPEDYVVLFRGVITQVDADAGKVLLQINSPDDKKRSTIYKRVDTKLNGAITNSQTTIDVVSTANILTRILGPDLAYDSSFESYVRIDDEIIKFTGISGNQLTGCTRGAFSTIATTHNDEAEVTTHYRLRGNIVELALKIMSSGFDNNLYAEDVDAEEFNVNGPNTVTFNTVNLVRDHNVKAGDYITISGATNGANNVTQKEILDIVELEEGSYALIDGVTFVAESNSPAVCSFRSKWSTLPDGLRMANDEIDIDEHLRWYNLFLSSVNYDFLLRETIEDAREWMEEQIYSPAAAYSLPRKSRASMGYHIGPIPGSTIQIFDVENVVGGSQVKLKRSTNSEFYNEIIYQWDESRLEDDKFLSGRITISATSKNQIKGPNSSLIIKSKGLRTEDLADTIAASQSNRRLKRYEFAAETLTIRTTFADGFAVEVGDIVIYDGTGLQTPDIKTAEKGMQPRYFEVKNKSLNIKSAEVILDLVDTRFDGAAKYCLTSPSSLVSSGSSTTSFTIKEAFSAKFGAFEYRKWTNLIGAKVRVRSADFVTSDDSFLVSVAGNSITVSPALSFTPSADMVFELADFVDQPETTKLIYGFMSPLTGGVDPYQMI